jgi:transcriptional regulator with XRE-family HTH domain
MSKAEGPKGCRAVFSDGFQPPALHTVDGLTGAGPMNPKKVHKADGIALRIRQLRERKGLIRSQFAGRVGVAERTVEKWEKCKSEPEPSRLAIVAAEFEADLHWLRHGGEEWDRWLADQRPDLARVPDPLVEELKAAAARGKKRQRRPHTRRSFRIAGTPKTGVINITIAASGTFDTEEMRVALNRGAKQAIATALALAEPHTHRVEPLGVVSDR